MLFKQMVIFVCTTCVTFGDITDMLQEDLESQQYELIAHIIKENYKPKGRQVKLLIGKFPNELYKQLDFGTSVVTSTNAEDHEVENIVKYLPNTLLIECADFEQFEDAFLKAITHPYWHPHAHILINYRETDNEDIIAKMFYIMWYYRACNAIILRYNKEKKTFLVSHYSPYISEQHMLQKQYGCHLAKNLGIAVTSFTSSFTCEEGCHNVSLLSSARATKLGTCIGFSTVKIGLRDKDLVRHIGLFEDKGRNLHGFPMRSYTSEVPPFTSVTDNGNGTYTLGSRDGMMWNTMAELFNFTIDLSPVKNSLKKVKFNFENTINQIFDFSNRKADLFLVPVFIMELHIVDVDMTHFMKESGICFVSHRADFETMLFDLKRLFENYTLVVKFFVCFFSLWFGFFLFSATERGASFDQAGKDFLNALRNTMSISIQRPSKHPTFRLLLTVTLWGFFVVNFITQASIISFFTVFKRGREVETFDDIIQRGYNIVGMASPDVVLPDTDDKFEIINSRMVPSPDMLSCLNALSTRSDLFCLVECSIARNFERNQLNSKGQQYLHTATDRVHNRYLAMILQQYSPMTAQFNKYVSALFEAGIIKKWEEYRIKDVKDDVPLKALSVGDLVGIFQSYGFMLVVSCVVFVGELWLGFVKWGRREVRERVGKWQRVRKVRKAINLERKLGKIKHVDVAIQTNADSYLNV